MNIHRSARTCVAGRALLVERILRQGWTPAGAAAAAGVSVRVRTAYKWLRRFRLEGSAGLADRSSRPQHSPTQLQLEKAHMILELRRTRRMTAAKIAAVLHLARSTLARRLQRKWHSATCCISIRIRSAGSGGLGHRILGDRRTRFYGIGWEYVHVAIDDHASARVRRDAAR